MNLINKILLITCFIFIKIFSFSKADEKIKLTPSVATALNLSENVDAYQIMNAQKISLDDTIKSIKAKWDKAKTNFKQLMVQFHPDKYSDQDLANEITNILNTAHAILNDTYRKALGKRKRDDEAYEDYKKQKLEREAKEKEDAKLFNELNKLAIEEMDNNQKKRFIEIFYYYKSNSYRKLHLDCVEWKHAFFEIVKRAINSGLHIDTTFEFGNLLRFCLSEGSCFGNEEFFDLALWLVENGASEVNLPSGEHIIHWYPIYQALWSNHGGIMRNLGPKNIQLAEKFLRLGADLNVKDKESRSLLFNIFYECQYQDNFRKEVFKLFLKNGINYKYDLKFNGLLSICNDNEFWLERKHLFYDAIAEVIAQYRQKIDIYNLDHAQSLYYQGEKILENIMIIREKLGELSPIQIEMLNDGYYNYERLKLLAMKLLW